MSKRPGKKGSSPTNKQQNQQQKPRQQDVTVTNTAAASQNDNTTTTTTPNQHDHSHTHSHSHDHYHSHDITNIIEIDEKDCCDAFLCTVVGFLLLFGSVFVTYLNEYHYIVNQSDITLLNEQLIFFTNDKGETIIDSTKLETIINNNNSEPIYVYGQLNANSNDDTSSDNNDNNDGLMDPFDESLYVSYPGMAIRIECEIYQWIEIKETESQIRKKAKTGNVETTTKYRYKKKWQKKWIDSSKFEYQDNHYNPVSNEFDKELINALNIKPQRTIWTESPIYIANYPLSPKLYKYLENSDKWKPVTMEVSRTTELEGWFERNGYLFKPYDMTQWSQFTESDLNIENTDSNTGDDDTTQQQGDSQPNTQNTCDATDPSCDSQTTQTQTKKKKKKKGPFVGDVRMAIYSLDVRNEFVTFVGSIGRKQELNSESESESNSGLASDKSYELQTFRSSVSDNSYVSLKYGKIDSKDCFTDYESENVYTLYFLRGLSLIMSIGVFVSFQHILGYIVAYLPGKLSVEFGHLYGTPFVAYSTLFGVTFWGVVLLISWFVPSNEVVLGLLGIIITVMTILHFISSKKLAKLFELAHKELERYENREKQE